MTAASILCADQLPPYALEEDRVVEMTGAVRSVYMALELSLAHLRRFLVDRSVIPLYEKLEPVSEFPFPALPVTLSASHLPA